MKTVRYLRIEKRGRGLVVGRFAPAMTVASGDTAVLRDTAHGGGTTATGCGSGAAGNSDRPAPEPGK
ncbi:MAG: hypothetical protein KIT13_01070 [Burkholderiales bacterium]|nr:hypothetical protein [Burkholderiales bacterium]